MIIIGILKEPKKLTTFRDLPVGSYFFREVNGEQPEMLFLKTEIDTAFDLDNSLAIIHTGSYFGKQEVKRVLLRRTDIELWSRE